MELINNLSAGFTIALSFQNLWYCLLGSLIGTLIGVLPGIGPVATIAMLLPITFSLPPTASLIMLAGIYYGAQYGGSTTAILVNIPGESSSVMTTLDGYAMARQGRAGAALSIAAIGSFFAGCVATLLIALFAPALTKVAIDFGPAEYFSLMILGVTGVIVLSKDSMLKAGGVASIGLSLGIVGTDIISGDPRFTFGSSELSDGIGFAVVAMGIFGVAEIMSNLQHNTQITEIIQRPTFRSMLLTRDDCRRAWKPVIRGTFLGSILGVLPGGGAILASFAAYMFEKRISKEPERFGKGAIEGVAAPESANNAAAQTSFIPMLTLGIPSNAIMALMIGAMTVQGITPGPQVMIREPGLFWGVIASMWIGNAFLVILNLPLVGLWAGLLAVPYRFMFPTIILFCCIGVYSLSNSDFDLYSMAVFSIFGYFLSKLEMPLAPMVLGFVLGPMLEENLRRAMLMSRGDPLTFVTSPISATLLFSALVLIIMAAKPNMKRNRNLVFHEDS